MIKVTVPPVALTFDFALTKKVLREAGKEIKQTAKALIGRDASGRKYGDHTASGPGMPPGNISGKLAKELKVQTWGLLVSVKDTAKYATALEAGAHGGGRKKNLNRSHKKGAGPGIVQTARVMEPRPFLSVAAEGELPRLEKRMVEALTKGITLKELGK